MIPWLVLVFPLLPLIHADFCSSDPRVIIKRRECPSHRTLLQLPLIHGNPYHALHDSLWAVSHYLSKCITSPVTINLTYIPNEIHSCERSGSTLPWSVCVTYAIAKRINASITDKPSGCYSNHVHLGVMPFSKPVGAARRGDFRGMSWYGCSECAVRRTLVPLPDSAKADALANIGGAVFDMIGTPTRERERRVHILLYNRADTRRRQWTNADKVFDNLRNNDAAEVKYLHQMPTGLKEQANLYAWADIVLAPHGAAMANTVFMRAGAEVLEIWKHCNEHIIGNTDLPRDWTGWHAGLLGIGLRYLQCYSSDVPSREERTVKGEVRTEASDAPQKVRLADVFLALEKAMMRQQNRLIVLGEEISEPESVPDPVVGVRHGFFLWIRNDWGLSIAGQILLPVFATSCTAVLILQSRARGRYSYSKRSIFRR